MGRRFLPLVLAVAGSLVAGCGSSPDAPAPVEAAAPAPELVEVGHEREFRGLWVATVANLDFPTRPGSPPEVQQAELVDMLESMEDLRLNAVVFQVRSEGDAVYRSELEPFSRSLTGRQGEDPGWDPLAFLVEEAHARNIEVHAWFNPYRAGTVAQAGSLAPNHVGRLAPEHMHRYGEFLWMDPGAEVVRDRAVEVVLDVARRYDIDGVHFDDYFYPYPDGKPFPDDRTYAAYRDAGGTLARDDWRRHNVDELVRRVGEGLAAEAPHVRFGVSPFGIYRPGQPEGIRGLDQYASLYADPVRWMEEGWVDYLAPQLYWPTTKRAQAFAPLLSWWADLAKDGRHVFAGHALYRLGEDASWTTEEFREQVAITRDAPAATGQIWFRARHLLDRDDARRLLGQDLYGSPALTPVVAAMADVPVAPPRVVGDPRGLSLAHGRADELRGYAVYAERQGRWALERVVPAREARLDLPAGRYAVSAVGRHGVESAGVSVLVGAEVAEGVGL